MDKSTGMILIPGSVLKQSLFKSLPWIWISALTGIFFLIAWATVGGRGIYFSAIWLVAILPFLLLMIRALFRPFCLYIKERREENELYPVLHRFVKWLRIFLMITAGYGVFVVAGFILEYPFKFISNIITLLLLTTAVYTAFLKLPPQNKEAGKDLKALRAVILCIKIVMYISVLIAVLGFVRLAWRLFLLLLTIEVGGFLYRMIQQLIEGSLERLLSVEIKSEDKDQRHDDSIKEIMFRKQRRKTVRLLRFFFRNIFFFGGLYIILMVSGIRWDTLSSVISYTFFTLGNMGLSISSILKAYFTIIITFIIGRLVKDLLLYYFLPKAALDVGTAQAISNVSFIFIIGGGMITALAPFGVNLMTLGVVGGGLAVGIGFGLQNITNNIISGVILFFERPINVGDVIDVSDTIGTVRQIGIRSTVVITFNNIAVIIPNSAFISGTVVNWSWGDITMRLDVPVGVAYGSNVQQIKEILLEIARRHNLVKKKPSPDVLFCEFADSSLNFELRVWIKDLRLRKYILSDINFMIDNAFRKANIEIPFPQRDVYIKEMAKTKEEDKEDEEESGALTKRTITGVKKGRDFFQTRLKS